MPAPQTRAQTRRNRIAFLRNLIRLELEAAGLDRVRDPLVTVWLQQSPPAVGFRGSRWSLRDGGRLELPQAEVREQYRAEAFVYSVRGKEIRQPLTYVDGPLDTPSLGLRRRRLRRRPCAGRS